MSLADESERGRAGDLCLLGVTVPEEYGGSGMDATAMAIAMEELSAQDPAFTLACVARRRRRRRRYVSP